MICPYKRERPMTASSPADPVGCRTHSQKPGLRRGGRLGERDYGRITWQFRRSKFGGRVLHPPAVVNRHRMTAKPARVLAVESIVDRVQRYRATPLQPIDQMIYFGSLVQVVAVQRRIGRCVALRVHLVDESRLSEKTQRVPGRWSAGPHDPLTRGCGRAGAKKEESESEYH